MRLTTIGTGTVSPSGTRASAGHLVEAGGVRLLLDCGSGVVHGMARSGVDWMAITHVAITHFHTDHISDLPFLIFAWRHGAPHARTAPVEILGPAGIAALVQRLAAAFGDWVLAPGFPLGVRELEPGVEVSVGGRVAISCCRVPHAPESVAYAVTAGARRLVYTGDTGYDVVLGHWAAGCDLLLAECSLPESQAMPIHLTPEQCGELAAQAESKMLVLTHFYPPVEQVDIRGAVAARFSGPVVVATDGWSTEIEDAEC